MDNIIVHVRGGVVQDVEVPAGSPTVEIRDYDDGKEMAKYEKKQ